MALRNGLSLGTAFALSASRVSKLGLVVNDSSTDSQTERRCKPLRALQPFNCGIRAACTLGTVLWRQWPHGEHAMRRMRKRCPF